jgi:DinB superfamily
VAYGILRAGTVERGSMDVDLRTDRVGLLLDQLRTSVELSRPRFDGLTDAEYFWEPVPGAWSIRRRGEAVTSGASGPGEWLLDLERPEPAPPPVTTIAWRIGHLADCFAGRWEWTFGSRSIPPTEVFDFSPSAREATDQLWFQVERWSQGIEKLTDDQLDTVGYGQYPRGLDPQLPIIAIVWWVNREFIHHTAEVALLRDLWARQAG